MTRNRGFIQLSLFGWMAVAASVLFLAMGVALKVQTARLSSCEQASIEFRASVKSAGEAAAAEAKKAELHQKKLMEKANVDLKKARARNAALAKRLRDASASRSFVPPAPAVAGQPEGPVRFDRPLIDRAIRDFAQGAGELIVEGQTAVDDLENARDWARSLPASEPGK